MANIGRNDPCPCGSGKKYKKCCLNKTTHTAVNELTSENDIPTLIAGHDWYIDKYETVATIFYTENKEIYPLEFIELGIYLWMAYCDRGVPLVRKEAVSVAALEYLLAEILGLDVTQAALAKKYGVSVGSISSRYRDMEDELFDLIDELEDYMEVKQEQQVASIPRMVLERHMADLEQALSEHEFSSKEELQQFLDTFNIDESGVSKPMSKRERARELLFDAWESVGAERVRLAKRAIELYPDSADAYVILAEEVASSLKEMRDYYYRGMVAGEHDLGSDYFTENRGHFWGIIETRPYMRAKRGYAECSWEMGEYEEALDHYRQMLDLNPGDNQGIRYDLLRGLLELRQYEEAEDLLEKYPEISAHMAYNHVLLTFVTSGLSPHVDEQLEEAFTVNPYVPDYLLGKKALPDERPKYIGFGDELEAIEYAFDHVQLWWREKELLKRLHTLYRSQNPLGKG